MTTRGMIMKLKIRALEQRVEDNQTQIDRIEAEILALEDQVRVNEPRGCDDGERGMG